MNADVVVIGAGVVGACCARACAEAGLSVIVVDRGAVASGTRSPLAPTEPSEGISGRISALRQARRRSTTASRIPEYPRASAFARVSMIARVSRSENSGPCPTER